MIDTSKISRLAELIENASKISVVTHMKPDGDAMGSSLGMYRFLKEFTGKETCIVLNDRYPANLAFMAEPSEQENILVYSDNNTEATEYLLSSDLIICLDFNAYHRTENLEGALMQAEGKKVLIDHHLNPDTQHFSLVFSTPDISSASELLYHILKAMPQCNGQASNLPLKAAEALMTGMTTDTNNFNNSIYPSTFNMASELIAIGVDRDKILNNKTIKEGDAVIALASSGVHSNGFSLVRKVLDVESRDIKVALECLGGKSIGETLLTPTKIYVKSMTALFDEITVKAVSHITGGGFYENIPRSIPDGLGAVIDRSAVKVLPIFELIAKTGNIPERDMFNTYNMGVGMSIVVPAEEVETAIEILKANGEDAYVIGKIVESDEKIVIE